MLLQHTLTTLITTPRNHFLRGVSNTAWSPDTCKSDRQSLLVSRGASGLELFNQSTSTNPIHPSVLHDLLGFVVAGRFKAQGD